MPRTPDPLDRLTRQCIAAHETVLEHGTPAMRGLSRLMLFKLADLIRRRMQVTGEDMAQHGPTSLE